MLVIKGEQRQLCGDICYISNLLDVFLDIALVPSFEVQGSQLCSLLWIEGPCAFIDLCREFEAAE